MRYSISKISLLFCYLLILVTGVFYYPKWKQSGTEATISWDVSTYYMYLPALFIYDDLKQCSFGDSMAQKYWFVPQFEAGFTHPSGNHVMQYAAGQAVLYSPFFFIGHWVASNSDQWPADGFSHPYQLWIGIGMLFYCMLGLYVLRKVLLRYFPDIPVAITLIAIVFATNYLNYAAIDGAMTHNTLFTLYAILLLVTIRFYQKPGIASAIFIGLLTGLATLIRPTEIISWLIPLCWGVHNRETIKGRWRFMMNHLRYPLLAIFAFLLVVSIQPIYWKWVSGSWVVYSYQDQGFSFLSPHIYSCLFSTRAGWLIYSPIMLLAIIGLVSLYRFRKDLFYTAFIFLGVFTYICFSWDIWWYGGSLGQRAMIQAYPVFAFALTAFFQRLYSGRSFMRFVVGVFLIVCIIYNFWLTHQAHRGGLLRLDQTTDAYFLATLGRFESNDDIEKLLDNSDRFKGQPQNVVVEYVNNFDSDSTAISDRALEGSRSIRLDKDFQRTEPYNFKIANPQAEWIRATALFSSDAREYNVWKMAQFIVQFFDGDNIVKTNFIRVHRILSPGEVKEIYLDARLPKVEFDRVSISFWNAGSETTLRIDNLKVESFR